MYRFSKIFNKTTSVLIKRNENVIRFISHSFKNHAKISEETFRSQSRKKAIGPFGWFLLVIPTSTFALGTWQVQRKQWKENLIMQLQEHVNATPVKLPENLEELEDMEYYPVHVRGQFLHDRELYMGPRTLLDKTGDASTSSSLMSQNQKSQGYVVITPFKLEDRDEIILVNRGWVPAKNRNPQSRKSGQVEGVTDVIGVVRLNENRPNFMPNNNPAKNSWFYRNLDEMSRLTGASPIFIDATNDFNIEGGPIGGQTRISIRNEHLSYIFTWYSLSALTSYMWVKQFVKVA